MPNYNVYYFVMKPVPHPVRSGTSGPGNTPTLTLNFDSSAYDNVRAQILQDFERTLQDLIQRSVQYIPHPPSRNQTVNVVRIPAVSGSPHVPDFSSLPNQPAIHEPIVYFVHRPPERTPVSQLLSPDDPRDRSPFAALFQQLEDGGFSEFPLSLIRQQRTANFDPSNARNEHAGMSLPGFGYLSTPDRGYAPVIACVYSDGRFTWDAANWQNLRGPQYAKTAFHEIAHCKAQCENRPTNNPRWESAINDIHTHHRVINNIDTQVAICRPQSGNIAANEADLRLMADHMLCPINFYRLDQPINNQCFNQGTLMQLTTPPPVQQESQSDPLNLGNIEL